MVKKTTKNEVSWQSIFLEKNYLKKLKVADFFEITSKQINKFREARLMTKFDSREVLPDIFKKNNLAILPISRGTYVVGPFKAYIDVPPLSGTDTEVQRSIAYGLGNLESIDFETITSEAVAINAAYLSKVLHDFVGASDLYLTTNGRLGSGSFNYNIDLHSGKVVSLNVEKAQMEIDAGFEIENALILIEAKNVLSETFLVRQLYYPYRYWEAKIEKPIRTVFQVYTNNTFYLFEYTFDNPQSYNSIRLINAKAYQFRDREIAMTEIGDIADSSKAVELSKVNFPQANSFEVVISLCETILASKEVYQREVTEKFQFDKRQTSYYADACIYLGLVKKSKDKEGVYYSLTTMGRKTFKGIYSSTQLGLVKAILSRPVFLDTYQEYRSTGVKPNKDFVVQLMKKHPIKPLNKESTYRRRADTVLAWMDWILALPDDY